MTTPTGMLSLEQLSAAVDGGQIDTVLVGFTDLYGRLMGKRFDGRFFLQTVADGGTHACDYLLTVDMEMEPVAGYDFANWEKGYGDFHLTPDFDTLRIASWLDRTAMVLADVYDQATHTLIEQAPRSMLRRQIERAASGGFSVMAASEIEYYLFRDSFREAAGKRHTNLESAGWYIEDYHLLQGTREEFYNGEVRRHLAGSGIPVENSKGEWGRGQHEMNIQYAEILEMADRHTVMKQAMKEIADGLGVSVTFMAKPSAEEAGSSCHLHVSLWEGDSNAFPGEHPLGPIRGSDVFRWFLGGWMSRAPDLMVFMAPTINSYKRYQDDS
ncbi:MAG: glutamine synthetase, partial [Planctomycetes bacterium]|nr:glutamine synthetase [Planctomycetota bacterium]